MKHRLQILGAALLFSTGGAAIKATTLGSWQVAGLRSGVAALALLLLLPSARRGWSWKLLPLAAAYAATLVLFVAANKLTTSANAIFLQSTAPLYVLLLGPMLLREPLRRRDALFMIPIVTGLAIFFLGADQPLQTAPDPARGNFFAMLSGICYALTVTGMRWMGRAEGSGGGDAVPMVAAGNLLAFVACLPGALPITHAAPVDWAVISYLGVFQIALAYVLLTSGIRHVGALETSTLLMLEPALNPIWAWLVHGESPTAWAITGGVLIIGATAAKTYWDERFPGRPAPGALPETLDPA